MRRRTDGTRIDTATARESSLPQNESKAMHAADPPDDEKRACDDDGGRGDHGVALFVRPFARSFMRRPG